MMHMKKRLLALAICITLLLVACGKKPATPADSKAEKEATVSDVKKNDNVSKDETEAAADKSGDSYTDYEYSESVCEDYSYDDGGYTEPEYGDYGYDAGGYYDGGIDYGNFSDGMGGYLCDYGSYYAEINTPDGPRTKAYINIYNSNGLMTADIYVYDINDNYDTFSCTVYQDATEAFGDASRDTEVEMNVQCIDSSAYSYNGEVIGGSLIATVYWPSSKCYFKLKCADGTVYEYTCYPNN